MKIRKTIIGWTALVGGLAWTATASAITVFADFDGDMNYDASFTPSSSSFTGTVYANVEGAFVEEHGGLLSYGVRASNDPPTFLDITGIDSDAGWLLPDTIEPSLPPPTDVVDVFDGTLGTGRSGLVPLFDITFGVEGAGVTTFTMEDVFPDNASFDGFVAEDGFVADGSIEYLDTEINTVPIPAAAWLFGSGLLGIIGIARRKKT
jgi:hypothetical protein